MAIKNKLELREYLNIKNSHRTLDLWQKGENVMLDFTLSDGKRMTLEDCGDCLNAKLWTKDGEYMGEINWDIDSIADMLFTE